MARAGVVGMAVSDQRAVYGPPRVDKEISGGAVDAAIGKGKDGVRHRVEYRRRARHRQRLAKPPGRRRVA